jgi:tRNA (guanine37-N1)-methyltransferase
MFLRENKIQRVFQNHFSLSSLLLKMRKISPIVNDGESKTTKLLLLKLEIKNKQELPKDLQNEENFEIKNYQLEIGYDHLDSHTILREILPKEIKDVPSSFESVGHVAHLNLNQELLPYKNTIGQILIDKNPAIKTVVNKEGMIESTFREFKMELIAGIDDLNVDLVRE